MSLKHLMFLTSSLATAGMALIPMEAQAEGVRHTGNWGKAINNAAGEGIAGLDCQMPQVQRPQTVGPVAVPRVGNFAERNNGGMNVNVARPFSGNTNIQANESGNRIGGMNLDVQRPQGVRNFDGGNINSGPVNAYRPNSSRLNVTTPVQVNPENFRPGNGAGMNLNVQRPTPSPVATRPRASRPASTPSVHRR